MILEYGSTIKMSRYGKRKKFNGKIYTLDWEFMHKSMANQKARKLRKQGWNVRVIERKSTYSGLEVFNVYKRRS